MKRRMILGNSVINPTQTPTLKFSADHSKMILTFPILSDETPTVEENEETNPQRHTHRDIVEITGGDAYGSQLTGSFVSVGNNATVLNLSLRVNSKVPGTGAA